TSYLYTLSLHDALPISIFPALMMGIFSKKMNDKGAIAGMVAGLGCTLLYIFTYLGWFFVASTAMLPNTPEHWVMGVSPLSFGARSEEHTSELQSRFDLV